MNTKKDTKRKTFRAFISKDTKTIPLMDDFEVYTNARKSTKKYDRLIFSNLIQSYHGTVRIILERSCDVDLSNHDIVGEITMSQFKADDTGKLKSFISSQLVKMDRKDTSKEYKLSSYFAFRAQDSNMRRGFGSYYGGSYYHKGREYGECNYYYVTGLELIHD